MAILVAVFAKIKQILSSYVLTSTKSPFSIGIGTYSMPLVYFIILGCVVLIAYFLWQSYRQEVYEEKLQDKAAAKEESFSTYNLTWINKLINWAYMSSPECKPEALQRWMEDINTTIAKTESPIKVLVYAIREGSIPPMIREVGETQKKQDHIEVPVLLDMQEFGFTISVQEQDNGRVIASTYTAAVAQFQCWYNVIISRIDGQGYLAKLEALLDRPVSVKLGMKLQSDQKISTTVPEVVADIVKNAVLKTPFYLNLSTWGPIIPISAKRRKSSSPDKKPKKDTNGNPISPKRRSKKSQGSSADVYSRRQTEPVLVPPKNLSPAASGDDTVIRKSNTLPVGTLNALSERLKASHGLSGSLGSLVGIKRTPSGRGPAKPIRSREKCVVIRVTKSSGLPAEGTLCCQATLDYPRQTCQTNPVKSGLNWSWQGEELMFDLSSRSSEVKLVFHQKMDGTDSAIASTVLHLDKIDIDKKSEISLPLKTANKENAEITLQLDFTENPVDPASQKFSSPRRSLDLSLITNDLPPMVDEKGDARSKSLASTLSSFSSENMSPSSSKKDVSASTTVRTTTTKKVSPRRKSAGSGMPMSKSAPNMKQIASPDVESDIATYESTVAETVLKDLSAKAEIEKHSPQSKTRIKKGKVTITAISKTNINGESATDEQPAVNGFEGDHKTLEGKLGKGDEMYYSTESLHAQKNSGSTPAVVEQNAEADKSRVPTSNSGIPPPEETKPKKNRRKTEERPKSLVSGVRAEDMPSSDETEWPKVRRSRSLVFGKGKKSRQYKTGSATDLQKHANSKGENEDDSMLSVPENELQKHNKKKKSKSITKLFSKLGRKPSLRKSRKPSDIAEGETSDFHNHSGSAGTQTPDPSNPSDSVDIQITPATDRPNSFAESEGDSSITESMDPTESLHSSLNGEKGVKRSKSLRKRLFGGKRKSSKN